MSVVIGFVTALAALITALGEIAHGGHSAIMVTNDILLYTGNIVVYVFSILVVLGLLLFWIVRNDPTSPSEGGGWSVVALSLIGGIYWGITADLQFHHMATRIIGGALLASLAALVAYLFAPTTAAAVRGVDEPGGPAQVNADDPRPMFAAVAAGAVGLCAFLIIAIGNANGYSRGGFREDIVAGREVIIPDPGPGRSWIATRTKVGYLTALKSLQPGHYQDFKAMVQRGEILLIQNYTHARVIERNKIEFIASVRFLDGPFQNQAAWIDVKHLQAGSRQP